MIKHLLNSIILIYYFIDNVNCHGRMDDPPSRNSAWRFLPGFPPDYDDNGLNWEGICGGKQYAHGGKYATGKIVKTYRSGEIISIHTLLTANHLGHIELKLCPVNDKNPESQECLDRHKLEIMTKSKLIGNDPYKARVVAGDKKIVFDVKLPPGLVCEHCVLQWLYRAGNNPEGSVQETFRNCADIEIAPSKDVYSLIDTSSSEITDTATIKIIPNKSNKKKKNKKKKNKKSKKKSKNKLKQIQPAATTASILVDVAEINDNNAKNYVRDDIDKPKNKKTKKKNLKRLKMKFKQLKTTTELMSMDMNALSFE